MAWVWAAGDALFCTGWVADRSADRRTTDARETGAGLLRAGGSGGCVGLLMEVSGGCVLGGSGFLGVG